TLDHQGVNATISVTQGIHRFKTGVQYDRNPLVEHFSMTGEDVGRFAFDGAAIGQTIGAFVQDTLSPVPDLHVSLGVRVDRYKLLGEETAISPRIGVAYHVHDTGTVFRASYNRIFMPPFSENLLLSSSAAARALAADQNNAGEDVHAERQHAFEVGWQQALG